MPASPLRSAQHCWRWALAAIAFYATIPALFWLGPSTGWPLRGAEFLSGPVGCCLATLVTLVHWVRRDIASKALRDRPLRSTSARFLPGLLLIFAAVPVGALSGNGALGGFLLVSGNMYWLLAIPVELAGRVWASRLGLSPPKPPWEPVLNRIAHLSVLNVFLGIGPMLMLSAPLRSLTVLDLLATEGLGTWFFGYGSAALLLCLTAGRWPRSPSRVRWPASRWIQRGISDTERLGLALLAMLHISAALGLLWVGYFILLWLL